MLGRPDGEATLLQGVCRDFEYLTEYQTQWLPRLIWQRRDPQKFVSLGSNPRVATKHNAGSGMVADPEVMTRGRMEKICG